MFISDGTAERGEQSATGMAIAPTLQEPSRS